VVYRLICVLVICYWEKKKLNQSITNTQITNTPITNNKSTNTPITNQPIYQYTNIPTPRFAMDIIQNKDFKNFIKEIKQKIYSAKNKAILSANRLMIELYFDIGKEIVNRQEKYGWGKSIVEQMSKELKDEFGAKSGYSTQNLWYMRQFYLAYKDYPNLQQLVGEIPWSSNILIFSKCKDIKIALSFKRVAL